MALYYVNGIVTFIELHYMMLMVLWYLNGNTLCQENYITFKNYIMLHKLNDVTLIQLHYVNELCYINGNMPINLRYHVYTALHEDY